MNLYELFILGINIKYIVFSILYKHINVPMACKELSKVNCMRKCTRLSSSQRSVHKSLGTRLCFCNSSTLLAACIKPTVH